MAYGLSYTLIDGGTHYSVIGYTPDSNDDVVIPSTYNGLPVTEIGENAFGGTKESPNITLKSVTIPEGVVSLGDSAFHYCNGLESITIPNSVTYVGEKCFANCGYLETVNIGSGLATIGNYAFSASESLTQFIVSGDNDNFKAIDGNLYSKDGTVLVQYAVGKPDDFFDIPSFVTEIGTGAFNSCKLVVIDIPDNVTTLGIGAFYGTSVTRSVKIGKGVTVIPDSCFSNKVDTHSILESITIGENITIIGSSAFGSNPRLKSIVIPNKVTSIGNYCFIYCHNLEVIDLLCESVPTLGTNAFIDTSASLKLYCSSKIIDYYEAATDWQDYISKFVADDIRIWSIMYSKPINKKFDALIPKSLNQEFFDSLFPIN